MSLAAPSEAAAARANPAKTSVHGFHVLGRATTIARDATKVSMRAGSASVEVTALAPDLFRVGFFPQGRSLDYSSVAVVPQDWQSGPVTIVEEAKGLILATSAATAHLSLDPLRIGFAD